MQGSPRPDHVTFGFRVVSLSKFPMNVYHIRNPNPKPELETRVSSHEENFLVTRNCPAPMSSRSTKTPECCNDYPEEHILRHHGCETTFAHTETLVYQQSRNLTHSKGTRDFETLTACSLSTRD